jgi:formylmethanofuran dehydrogenase subunit E
MIAYITELDIIDPEYTAARAWVVCEECDEAGEAVDMVAQYDGAWLCPGCDGAYRAEWEEQQRYLERLYFGA